MTHQATRAELAETFAYNPDTGIFTWRCGKKEGAVAGGLRTDGYLRIKYRGREYACHRVAWLFMTGEWPQILDHRDMNKTNNSWGNLREATPTENNANTVAKGDLGKGVTFHRQAGRYQAQIKCKGKNHYLGLFSSVAEANAAYARAAKVLFGEYARAT